MVSTLRTTTRWNALGDTGYELTTEVMEPVRPRGGGLRLTSRLEHRGNVMGARLRRAGGTAHGAVRLRDRHRADDACAPRAKALFVAPYAMPDGTLPDICGHACAPVEQSWTTAPAESDYAMVSDQKASEPSIAERSARLRALPISLNSFLKSILSAQNPPELGDF